MEGGVPGCDADEGVTDLDLDEASGVLGLSLSFFTWLLLLLLLIVFAYSVGKVGVVVSRPLLTEECLSALRFLESLIWAA